MSKKYVVTRPIEVYPNTDEDYLILSPGTQIQIISIDERFGNLIVCGLVNDARTRFTIDRSEFNYMDSVIE
jgi:hypothetical protein